MSDFKFEVCPKRDGEEGNCNDKFQPGVLRYTEMTLKEVNRHLSRKECRGLRRTAKQVAKMNGEKLKNIKIVKGDDNFTLFVPPQPIRGVFEDIHNLVEWNGDGFDIKLGEE